MILKIGYLSILGFNYKEGLERNNFYKDGTGISQLIYLKNIIFFSYRKTHKNGKSLVKKVGVVLSINNYIFNNKWMINDIDFNSLIKEILDGKCIQEPIVVNNFQVKKLKYSI